ncbi:hypothetical protein LRD69_27440 [Streptomyces sp. JH14]|uniref:hypothetical protein n=1 Tax=Streptomyces sp. JH14 TaxID=2793630 RepID=UPI0023F6C124|nr:hypothetical protein [Streptomyces sp. JH14]MDF6045815.1 hypothetical protein [Streptomyces sp. JH14]
MTVHQLADEVAEFAQYLRNLTALLDPGRGWYGVFVQRDPAGMRACLDGAEIPPWDVVESLLQDLAGERGTEFAERESVRAAALYAASAAAHDRRPGGRQALLERLELMLREETYAARRVRAAGVDEGTRSPGPETLAWAQDDHARAAARCTELRKRLAAVTVPQGWFRSEKSPGAEPARPRVPGPRSASGSAAGGPPGEVPASDAPQAPAALQHPSAPERSRPPGPKRRKPRGARFAGLDVDDDDNAVAAPLAAPVLPAPPVNAAVPRGARFGGAPTEADAGPRGRTSAVPAPDPAARRAAAEAVETLVRLRAEGRSGEAHVVLCEAAGWPAARLPLLAVELHGSGLAADWATLLWEVSSLPPVELAAAAGALAAAGRADDCGQLLRQGVARPAAEIADAVLALDRAGLGPEVQALMGAFVRVHTPQDAALIAAGDPHRLVPQLLAAARAVSPERQWDLVHALRVAGIADIPG